jgi:hypothetical protein
MFEPIVRYRAPAKCRVRRRLAALLHRGDAHYSNGPHRGAPLSPSLDHAADIAAVIRRHPSSQRMPD